MNGCRLPQVVPLCSNPAVASCRLHHGDILVDTSFAAFSFAINLLLCFFHSSCFGWFSSLFLLLNRISDAVAAFDTYDAVQVLAANPSKPLKKATIGINRRPDGHQSDSVCGSSLFSYRSWELGVSVEDTHFCE